MRATTICDKNHETHTMYQMTVTVYHNIISHSNLDRTYVVFNIMSFAGKPLVKILYGHLQSHF